MCEGHFINANKESPVLSIYFYLNNEDYVIIHFIQEKQTFETQQLHILFNFSLFANHYFNLNDQKNFACQLSTNEIID
ncbi:hypothetical protein V1477_001009 [Vespula maculifrons]|uniref:Uncharacterized protein n=1 Tax=Vespula maculifrons TaxID=7453 RepID=A0ABD2D0M0_VESMC